ncbi:hypothetical protein K7J31_002877 [Vibrio parahaemolyticus]|nr:hypothetical protein [Vibrio parahaemolyticus]
MECHKGMNDKSKEEVIEMIWHKFSPENKMLQRFMQNENYDLEDRLRIYAQFLWSKNPRNITALEALDVCREIMEAHEKMK